MNETMLRVRASGVTFAPGYPRNLVDLQRRCWIDGPVDLELVRDLDNAEDLNATSIRLEGRHLGWVPRDFAAFIAPQIDAGAEWCAQAVYVAVDLDHKAKPGLEVQLIRKGDS